MAALRIAAVCLTIPRLAAASPQHAELATVLATPANTVAAESQPAAVAIQSDPPGVAFQVSVERRWVPGSRGVGWFKEVFQPICTAPCTATLPLGTPRIGMSAGGFGVVAPESPVAISGPGTLRGIYYSRRGLQTAGLLTFVLGDALGGGLSLATVAGHNALGAPNGAMVGVGLGVAAVSTVVGMVLMFQRDAVAITFVPGAPSLEEPNGVGHDVGRPHSALDLRGGSLAVRF